MTTDHAARELMIRELARYYLNDAPEAEAAVDQLSAEHVREHFLRVLGYDEIADAETRTQAEIDLSRAKAGVVGVKLWIRDRATLNKLKSTGILSAPFHGLAVEVRQSGEQVDDWDALARITLREPGTRDSRAERLRPADVAAALAVYYLSRRGRGRLSVAKAIQVVQTDCDQSDAGRFLGDERQQRSRIDAIQRRLGPLIPADPDS